MYLAKQYKDMIPPEMINLKNVKYFDLDEKYEQVDDQTIIKNER